MFEQRIDDLVQGVLASAREVALAAVVEAFARNEVHSSTDVCGASGWPLAYLLFVSRADSSAVCVQAAGYTPAVRLLPNNLLLLKSFALAHCLLALRTCRIPILFDGHMNPPSRFLNTAHGRSKATPARRSGSTTFEVVASRTW